MQLQPCLFFDGRAGEAMAFYKQALGAETPFCMYYRMSGHSTGAHRQHRGAARAELDVD